MKNDSSGKSGRVPMKLTIENKMNLFNQSEDSIYTKFIYSAIKLFNN